MARRSRHRGHIEGHRGKYRAILSAGTDPLTGTRRFLKTTCATKKQAEIELTRLLNQVDEQRHPRSKILVRQLVQKWFEVEDHEDSTRERYVGLHRRYIDPVFGSMQAARLDAELLETFYARWRNCRELCEEDTRAPATPVGRYPVARFARSTSSCAGQAIAACGGDTPSYINASPVR
jgi:integrase